jgi:hypothetical protein
MTSWPRSSRLRIVQTPIAPSAPVIRMRRATPAAVVGCADPPTMGEHYPVSIGLSG